VPQGVGHLQERRADFRTCSRRCESAICPTSGARHNTRSHFQTFPPPVSEAPRLTASQRATELMHEPLYRGSSPVNTSHDVIEYLRSETVTAAEQHASQAPRLLLPKVLQLHRMIQALLRGESKGTCKRQN
jgi:hypothetical protein